MFTGIVERTARVEETRDTGGGRRFAIRVREDDEPGDVPPWRPAEVGESIAVDGCCLTAVEVHHLRDGGLVAFDIVPETLERTTLGARRTGDRVNLERSLRVGDTLGGHWVTGHIDATGEVAARDPRGDEVLFTISAPSAVTAQVLPKGSVAVDGISLTVVDVDRSASRFTFAAIPHTLERTTLGERAVGDAVNLESDVLGKWVLRGLDALLEGAGGEEGLRRLLGATGRSRPAPPEPET